MPPAQLPRRQAARAIFASAAPPSPDARARAAAPTAPPVAASSSRPSGLTPRVTAAPPARLVDRAYRPRPALQPRAAAITPAEPVVTATVDPLHLARRATWGATPALVEEIRTVGVSAWLDAQLAPTTIPDTAMDTLAAATWKRLGLAIWEVHDQYWPNSTGDVGQELVESYVARAVWSRRQLLEVMTDFWTNHLVVTAPWGEAWDSAHRFHIDVIRKHALGRYADMLAAAARHPAMLRQLDNVSSSKRSPNENFGREVLELHTVGVDGGYLESDIRTSALVMTGVSVEDESGEYLYRHIRHHRGAVSLLGWSDANASTFGQPVADSYLIHLARHPRTARRIATKLAVRFVSDAPPASLVDRLAQVYLDNDTRIAPVLKVLFTSTEFASSVGQKVKRPLENIVSTARVLGAAPGTNTRGWLGDLLWTARVAGQAPMAWPAPNGYPDVATAWSGAGVTLGAWNWHMGQGWEATSSTPKVAYPALRTLLPATLPTTYGGLVDALAARLLLGPLPAAKRDAVCAFLDKTAAASLKSTDAAVGWRLPYVVALVLDSPEFALR